MIFYWLITLINAIDGVEVFELQTLFLAIYTVKYLVKKDKKLENQLLLAWSTYPIYLLITMNMAVYLPITALFFSLSVWMKKRTTLYQPPFNRNNLCIALYRGNNNTYKGRFTALLGLDVTSIDLYYRSYIYRYKKGKLIKQKTRNLDDYLLIDTRKSGIIRKLNKLMKLKYETKFYKSNCVEILKPMLKELNLEPKGYLDSIPSNYARSVLSARK